MLRLQNFRRPKNDKKLQKQRKVKIATKVTPIFRYAVVATNSAVFRCNFRSGFSLRLGMAIKTANCRRDVTPRQKIGWSTSTIRIFTPGDLNPLENL